MMERVSSTECTLLSQTVGRERNIAGDVIESDVRKFHPSSLRAFLVRRMWLGAESNRRHEDFQSSALPTELPSLRRSLFAEKRDAHYANFRLEGKQSATPAALSDKFTLFHKGHSICNTLMFVAGFVCQKSARLSTSGSRKAAPQIQCAF